MVFFGLGQGGGEDALRYTWADLITATVLWLAGLAAVVLIFSPTASPYFQRRAALGQSRPAGERKRSAEQ